MTASVLTTSGSEWILTLTSRIRSGTNSPGCNSGCSSPRYAQLIGVRPHGLACGANAYEPRRIPSAQALILDFMIGDAMLMPTRAGQSEADPNDVSCGHHRT